METGRTWKDNIEVDMKETGADWINLNQENAFVNITINTWVPWKDGYWTTVSFSGRIPWSYASAIDINQTKR
jgi:hypothetical protein